MTAKKPKNPQKSLPANKKIDPKSDKKKSNSLLAFKLQRLKQRAKKHWKRCIPYIVFGYLGNKLTFSYRQTTDKNFWMRLVKSVGQLDKAFESPFPSFNGYDLLGGLVAGLIILFIVWYKRSNAKKYRTGYEYGSAKWSNADDIEPFRDSQNPDNNIILTLTEWIRLTGKCIEVKYDINKNVLIVGGSGSGKTRFFVLPNIMQLIGSYVITDPKGQLIKQTGHLLEQGGYRIVVFNTIDLSKSMHYNPFAYIRNEQDIMKFVTIFMENTKGDGHASDPFWDKSERLLYMAFIGFIFYECIPEEQNFGTLSDMISACEVREDDEDFKNAIDLIFEDLEREVPDHFAVRQYAKLKLAAGKTLKSILISAAVRLEPFDTKDLREITEYDELELDMISERKTAFFMMMSDTEKTYNFLVAMLESQMLNMLCDQAFKRPEGKLKYHVRLILDEFANIGRIPDFEQKIAVIRSREISTSIILQSKAQLKALYKEHAETIVDNCDTHLFLGGKGKETLKELSELLGKETIDVQTYSENKGQSPSSGTNNQRMGKELMTPDEIAVMDGSKCILQVKGVRPFLSSKFDITKHKRYKLLSDYDKKMNAFDVSKYLSTQLRLRKDQVIDAYNMGTIEETDDERREDIAR